jgi:hypothetical protein
MIDRVKPNQPERMLLSRRDTARVLGYKSVESIKRLERAGRLKPRRPSGKQLGQVFHLVSDVMALAREDADA